MRRIGPPDGGQFTGAMQLGEVDRIASVGFDPITWLARDQRRSDHGTFVPDRAQMALDAIAARSGFVAKSQRSVFTGQLHTQRLQGRGRASSCSTMCNA